MGKLILVITMLINNNLKSCREELEITQEELGKVLGVSRKTVTGWENNYDSMPLTKLVKFFHPVVLKLLLHLLLYNLHNFQVSKQKISILYLISSPLR